MPAIIPKHKYFFFGPYLTEMEVNPEYCQRLLKTGRTLKKSYRNHLAGQIDQEYNFDLQKDPWIVKDFEIYINSWIDGFRNFTRGTQFNPTYEVHDFWINFQKSKEYNPLHIHMNCDLSFILWLQVPQKMLNEGKKNITSAANPGSTTFVYGEPRWDVITEKICTPKKNTLMMFPANLRHHVMHFNSKVTRISVSGNIKFV